MVVNEHQLQQCLTRAWVRDGVRVGGEQLFLAAWEVMDNYRINSAQHGFGRPAIDFLLIDRGGRLVAVELKMIVRAPRDCWSVLCQVTHRAHLLAAAFDHDRLESAYQECYSGRHGRVETTRDVPALRQAHAAFYDCDALPTLPGLPVRRVVAAPDFGPSLPEILHRFTTGPRQSVLEELARYSPNGRSGREFRRFRELAPDSESLHTPEVLTLTVPVPPPAPDATVTVTGKA